MTDAVRVLFVAEKFWPSIGGAQVQALRLINSMRSRGYEFTVVTTLEDGYADVESHQGIPIHRFPFLAAIENHDLESILRIRKGVSQLARSIDPQIIHALSFGPSAFFLQFMENGNTPLVFEVCNHFGEITNREDSAVGKAVRAAAWVTANSVSTLNHLQRLIPEITNRSSVIYYGVRAPDVDPTPLPVAPPQLLCYGRLAAEKGFDIALRAFAIVLKRLPDARLRMVGDGDARPVLEKLAADLGISHAVTFSGFVEPAAIPEVLNETTLVLMPSRWEEAFGLVAAETALMARPIVATRVGGLPEVIQHDVTGVLVPKDDPSAMARAAIALLEQPDKLVRLGRAGRDRATKVFSPEGYTTHYDELYRKLAHEAA